MRRLGRLVLPGVIALVMVCRGAASAQCVGDCNGDGEVTIDEIVHLISRGLRPASVLCDRSPLGPYGVPLQDLDSDPACVQSQGTAGNDCAAGDANFDGTISIDEIVTAVQVALSGCAAGELSLYGVFCSQADIHCAPPAELLFCDAPGTNAGLCLLFDGDSCGGIRGTECPPGLLCFARTECCDAGGPCVTPQQAQTICASAAADLYPCAN